MPLKTITENNALFQISRVRPWWINHERAPMNPTKTKLTLAGRLAALAIVTAFVVYCAAALVRALW